jgi:phage baseplate assembly protein W
MATLNLDILKRENVLEEKSSSNNIIYKDLHLDVKQKFPLRDELEKNYQVNDIIADVNIDAISNSFVSLLTTSPGEKILNPLFGINFGDLLFLPVTAERADVIGSNIISSIEKFEPRIKIISLTITPVIDEQEYICDFEYTIPRFNNSALNIKGKLSSSGFYI